MRRATCSCPRCMADTGGYQGATALPHEGVAWGWGGSAEHGRQRKEPGDKDCQSP